MQRLGIIEEKLNKAAPIPETTAQTDKKTAFQTLKCNWMPMLMDKLCAIHTEIQNK